MGDGTYSMMADNPARSSTKPTDQITTLLNTKRTQKGVDLATLSLVSPVLLVFLRHSGCVFCREALWDLAASREAIERSGTHIVVVSFGDEKALDELLALNHLSSLDRIQDDNQSLYHAFGLHRGSWWQLAGPRVWWRGVIARFKGGHRLGPPAGDVRQMPGMFLLNRCEVVRSFRHESASDRPLYQDFVRA